MRTAGVTPPHLAEMGIDTMNHMEFATLESQALEDTPKEKAMTKWLERVAADFFNWEQGGTDVWRLFDGDEPTDGYSLDGAWEAFESGMSPQEYRSTLPA